MRERLLEGGMDSFLDHELLEYILSLAIPRRDTKPLAKRLLDEFGDLPSVLAANPDSLLGVHGMGDGAATALKFVEACMVRSLQRCALGRPVLTGMKQVLDYLHARLGHQAVEEFRVLFLNNRNLLIRDEAFGSGTVNQAPVYPREVIRRALELQASAVLLVHNHPAGDPTPSRDDIQITHSIIQAGRPLGIAVHDHLVIARSAHASLRALGLI
jgi:DNA repair protein RadC